MNDLFLRRLIKDTTLPPCQNETLLVAFCMEHQKEIPILSDYPFIVEYEYVPDNGSTNPGKGDLILTNSIRNYLIVEVKYLTQATGKSAVNRRKYQRKKVKEQVTKYLDQFRLEFPTTLVDGLALTNEVLCKKLRDEFEVFKQLKIINWEKRKKSLYPKNRKKLVT